MLLYTQIELAISEPREGTTYALLNSEVASPRKDDNISTYTYNTVSSIHLRSVRKNDILLLHALVKGTYEPPVGDETISTFSAYIACDGVVVSPVTKKSMRRYRGNHHGSLSLTGSCRITDEISNPITVALMVKFTRTPGIIHPYGTTLVVNHYRPITSTDDLSQFWAPIDFFSITGHANSDFFFQNPADPYGTRYKLLSVEKKFEPEDKVYISAHATADDPDPEIPMFGFELIANSKRLSGSSENPIPTELSRISLNALSMWSPASKKTIELQTRVYGLQVSSRPNMRARPHLSRLEGIIFRKNRHPNSMFLTNAFRSKPPRDMPIRLDNSELDILTPKTLTFAQPGIVRIKAHATIKNKGSNVKSCYLRIAVEKNSKQVALSAPASRSFKLPYVFHSLHAELVYGIKKPGDYTVRPYLYCASQVNEGPITLIKNGSEVFIDKFEQEP